MNELDELLLKIIIKSQFGTSDFISFDGIDINELYTEAFNQAVQGLIVYEIPDDYLDEKLRNEQFRQKYKFISYCYAEDELKKILDKNSIPFVILKGNASAINYSNPSRRTMGDIDLLVPLAKFEETRDILSKNGYILLRESVAYTRHISFYKDGFSFELHRFYSHDDVDIEQYISDGLNNRIIASVDGYEFPMLPILSNGLVLLDHMRHHLKTSLGLRQVIDWMMYVYRNIDDHYWNNEFSVVAKEKGLDTLAITATRMCQIYLGLPDSFTWCKGADEKVCEHLINELLVSGNFGCKDKQITSFITVKNNIKNKGMFRWFQIAGEHNWKAYNRHHWLKPFCWIYQIFRYAKQGINTGRNRKNLKADLDRSKERYELLKKLGIE